MSCTNKKPDLRVVEEVPRPQERVTTVPAPQAPTLEDIMRLQALAKRPS